MKAAVIRAFGGPDVLRYEDVETPRPRPGHVLVKVLAAGINVCDQYVREGTVAQNIEFPHILGVDGVGEVADVGDGVTKLAIGDRVVPIPCLSQNFEDDSAGSTADPLRWQATGILVWGTYAQFMEVPARLALEDTSGVDTRRLATLPCSLINAVRTVRVEGRVKNKDRVLVADGATNTGSLSIQVAKILGAEVATIESDEAKRDWATTLGADLVLNAGDDDVIGRVQDWTAGQGVDVVVSHRGGDSFAVAAQTAKPCGIVAVSGFAAGVDTTVALPSRARSHTRWRRVIFGEAEDYLWGIEQVRSGRIRLPVTQALPLHQAALAHRLIGDDQAAEGLVLLPWAA